MITILLMMGLMGFGGMVETKEEDYVVVLRCCEHISTIWCMQGEWVG
jgi:hypothetical protein